MDGMQSRQYARHYGTKVSVGIGATEVFTYADDQTHLSSLMSGSSWKMGGGKMNVEFDENRGQKVGSRIKLSGRVFGIQLSVEEIVNERNPSYRKTWETTSPPRLLVIGHYRMCFEITPQGNASEFRVFIDYDLSSTAPPRWLGFLFGDYYARWCTKQMADDAAWHFASQS